MRIIITLILLFSGLAESSPQVNLRHIYYTVSPQSPNELLRSLNNATPVTRDGNVFHANVSSPIDWKFWWNEANGSCSITRVNVTVNVTITLPKLGDSPQSVKRIWRKWFPNLVRHENTHKDYALNIARQIEDGIANLPAERNCDLLEKKANRVGHRLMKKLSKMNKSYDKRTRHGDTEGASLYRHL